TPAGKIVKAGGHVVKNVAGYDFCRLLTGSYGALGVIAEISFKLFPLPGGRSSWRAAIPNLKAAREFRRRILDSPLGPMRMVLMDGVASALASQAPVMQRSERKPEAGAEMWLEFGGSEEVINRCARSLAELAKSVEISFQPLGAEAAEVGWDRISDLDAVLRDGGITPIALKATLPVASSEEFLKFLHSVAKELGVSIASICQNGVGIVQSFLMPDKLSSHLADSILKAREMAVQHGGALVVERCPVEMKRDLDVWGPPGNGFPLMKKLKEVWDPAGTLSPGRFVGGI
ncbi:MAG: FAD-binding oxidoreductase, partial [Acidobacteriota bacterium]|nr:FAD-binding oxidoreductase [Acidobacteriota bacterium]